MKRQLLILACAMPLAAYAASTPDKSFYDHATEAGLSEVSDGTLAAQNATDPKLKDYGSMMVKDHSAANSKLSALASTKGITVPTSASVAEMARHEKLKVLPTSSFDKSYIRDQINAHRATIRLLRKEIASGEDPDAKDFARSILPTVRDHLKAIDEIATADGVSTK